jgi:hypothetical protein
VFHAISTQLDRYINVYRNCEYVVHFSNQMYLKKKKKEQKKKEKNTRKKRKRNIQSWL